jgi:hypothetical protein
MREPPAALDPFLTGVLMRDLVGHDRMPSAFLVYLWLWAQSAGSNGARIGASLQTLASATGLSKSAVQRALRHLVRRQLLSAQKDNATAAPFYTVLKPWERRVSCESA